MRQRQRRGTRVPDAREVAMSATYCQFEAMTVPNPGPTTFNVVPAPNPAEPGNLRAAKHGAQSAALVNPRARELAEQVLSVHTHLDSGRDGPAVARYAVALARVERVYQWLGAQDNEVFANVETGETHAVFGRLERWERECEAAERALAIAPLVRVKLKLTQVQALDAATMMSEPDPALRRQLLERAGLIDPPGGVGIANGNGDDARNPASPRDENPESGVGDDR
jgi:hypothetical protein